MVDEVLLVLAEVLGAHILYGPQLPIVLVVDVIVASVDLLSDVFHVVAKRVNLLVQFLVEVIL